MSAAVQLTAGGLRRVVVTGMGVVSCLGNTLDAEYVMSNNFAFGGINTSLIFKRAG